MLYYRGGSEMEKKIRKLFVLSLLVLTLVVGSVTPAFARTIKGSATYYVGQSGRVYYYYYNSKGKLKHK